MTPTALRWLLVAVELPWPSRPGAPRRSPASSPATLVLRNGKIVTVDAAMPEAQAIAIRGDRIAAVGTNDQHPAVTSAPPRR